MQQTENYNFNLPEESDVARTVSREGYNDNFTQLDNILNDLDSNPGVLIVEFYNDEGMNWDGTFFTATVDKSYAEIKAAIQAGKIVMAKVIDDDDVDMAMLPLSWFYIDNSWQGLNFEFQGFVAPWNTSESSVAFTHIATAVIDKDNNAKIAMNRLSL